MRSGGYSTGCLYVLLATAIAIGGCASSGVERLDTATASVDDTRSQLDAGTAQVDAVVAALQDFSTSNDLAASFKRYDEEVQRLEKIADNVRARRAAMQSRMQDHIDEWNAELAEIQSESAREISSQRQAELSSSLTQLGAAMDDLKADYTPFISNLHDIRLLLANDLTTRGVELANPMINDAIAQADEVKSSINTAGQALADAIADFRR